VPDAVVDGPPAVVEVDSRAPELDGQAAEVLGMDAGVDALGVDTMTVVDADHAESGCSVIPITPIASVTGSCNSFPMRLPWPNPDVEHMTVYVDGTPIAREDWTTNGHAVTITICDSSDFGQHLISVSFSCIN